MASLAPVDVAQATHDYDGLVPTDNYAPVCVGIGSDWRNGTPVVCRTDNSTLSWYAKKGDPGELESADVDAVRQVLESQYEPTDLSVSYDSTPSFSGTTETDLIFQEADTGMPVPSGTVGIAWCNSSTLLLYDCDQTYIRIKGPDWYRQYDGSVTCHEIGHAVGLVHGSEASPKVKSTAAKLGCMVNGSEFPPDLGSAGAHQLNNFY